MIHNGKYQIKKLLMENNPKAYYRYLDLEEGRVNREMKIRGGVWKLEKFLEEDGEINMRGQRRIMEYDFIERVKEENSFVGNLMNGAYSVKNFVIDYFEDVFRGLGRSECEKGCCGSC